MTTAIQIVVATAECVAHGVGPIAFDNADLAIAFIKTLTGALVPEAFLDLFTQMIPGADALHSVRRILAACMGTPT